VSSREKVLSRYRHLRSISREHHSEATRFLSRDRILHQARRLGLTVGRTFVVDDIEDLHLVFDLLVYTAPTGRSRGIDRIAASASAAPQSDELLMLDAMRRARFRIVKVLRRHEAAGLIVEDLISRDEIWVVDEGWEASLAEGVALATRLYTPDSFSMTSGVSVPMTDALFESVAEHALQLRRKPVTAAVDDRRFAEAVYRTALASGIMENVGYQDVRP